jgi:hypothetical protein
MGHVNFAAQYLTTINLRNQASHERAKETESKIIYLHIRRKHAGLVSQEVAENDAQT